MKKILAIFLAVVMTFSMIVPAVAVNNESVAVVDASANESESTSTVSGIDAFLQEIYNAVHNLVHSLSKMFKFDCPFCHGKDDADKPNTPEEPSNPADDDKYEAVEVTAAQLKEILSAEIVNDSVTIELDNNYVVTDEWTSMSYPVEAYKVILKNFTINGNGHIIAGLTAPLFVGDVAQNIVIKDLTIADSNVASGNENGLGRGAILAYADAQVLSTTFENCKVVNTKITASTFGTAEDPDGYNAGAFMGQCENALSIKNCTVKNCEINGKSCGGFVGFYTTKKDVSAVIENSKVIDCTLSFKYVGQIVGTVNGTGELTISKCEFTGETYGRVIANATVTVK